MLSLQAARLQAPVEGPILTLESNLFLRICQLDKYPHPLPLQSGFTINTAYRALGLFNPSETSDAYVILSNNRDEIWFICNRHLKTVCSRPELLDFRIPLEVLAPSANVNPVCHLVSPRNDASPSFTAGTSI